MPRQASPCPAEPTCSLLVAGQPSSHCAKVTVEHLAEHRPDAALDRPVLLIDCTSRVSSFEALREAFLQRMRQGGAQLAGEGQVLAELPLGSDAAAPSG